MRRNWKYQGLWLLNLLVAFFVKFVNTLAWQYHVNNIASLLFILNFEHFWVKLLHHELNFHHDKLKHWVWVNVFILSKENSDPWKPFWYSDEVMGMSFVSIQGKKSVRNTCVSCYKLENRKENLLQVQIKIRFQVTESYWRLELHTL